MQWHLPTITECLQQNNGVFARGGRGKFFRSLEGLGLGIGNLKVGLPCGTPQLCGVYEMMMGVPISKSVLATPTHKMRTLSESNDSQRRGPKSLDFLSAVTSKGFISKPIGLQINWG